MSKIEEGNACDRFMSDIIPFVLPIAQRRFVSVEYSISPDEFVIKVSYDKDLFRHKINGFVCDIIKEAQKSDLHRYSWAVHTPLCEEIEEPNFVHTVAITITANQLKKKVALDLLVRDFIIKMDYRRI